LPSGRSIFDDYVEAARNLHLYASSAVRSAALWTHSRRGRGSVPAYDPDQYWEHRAQDLIATYDQPETWPQRGWTRAGVEEALVPGLLERSRARSAFVVGAGTGRQYGFLEPLGLVIRGIDISPTLAAECRHRYPEIPTDTDSIIGADSRHPAVDAVLVTAVLQHVRPEEFAAAVASVQALACKVVILREVTWLSREAAYMWAHDYIAAFEGWPLVHDEVTDSTEHFEVRLLAFAREDSHDAPVRH
jgi:SAM-dependent methyltransferase